MQYSAIGFRLGYYLICFSPILSLLLLALAGGIPTYLVIVTKIHTSIIVIQLLGLTLYLLGTIKQLARPSALFTSILLVIWGSCTSLWAWTWMGYRMEEVSVEIIRLYTVIHSVWMIKGVLWIIAGLVILAHARKS
ncbi:MAG: hypothetical protein PVH12_07060 [Candidatus Bathyarchaeota archaeon]|jgi:hypothetical protein